MKSSTLRFRLFCLPAGRQFRSLAVCLVLLTGFSAFAQGQPAERRISRSQYIDLYKDAAMAEMLRSGVPASITLAQGILESGDGNSPLAQYANNHFGIKCHKGWEGETFIQDDDARNECFRKYYSVSESYHDHSEFLRGRDRYSKLFELKITDYKGWAHGLKKAGYATNPKYPALLIRLIEDHELDQFDKVSKRPTRAAKKKEAPPVAKVQKQKESRSIKIHDNNIKFVIAKSGDSIEKIARAFELGPWQIRKYNDLSKGAAIASGDIIYLQPKRNKAKGKKFHKVRKGESMRDVSQAYGVKLKKLYDYNGMAEGEAPRPGKKLKLSK